MNRQRADAAFAALTPAQRDAVLKALRSLLDRRAVQARAQARRGALPAARVHHRRRKCGSG